MERPHEEYEEVWRASDSRFSRLGTMKLPEVVSAVRTVRDTYSKGLSWAKAFEGLMSGALSSAEAIGWEVLLATQVKIADLA